LRRREGKSREPNLNFDAASDTFDGEQQECVVQFMDREAEAAGVANELHAVSISFAR
jgi:hypothetical protein